MRDLDLFLNLSATLTGFARIELEGAGVGLQYLEQLYDAVGKPNAQEFLDISSEVGSEEDIGTIWDGERFGVIARHIVLMWYTGTWYELPEDWEQEYASDVAHAGQRVVSTEAYKQGLVWKAIGAHAPGANPKGFGSWANKPQIGN